VIVTVMDVDNYSADYLDSIRENRDEYAKKHGEKDPYPDLTGYAKRYRLHDVLPKNYRLRPWWSTGHMGKSP
jgi:hypothetical protein